jgi:PAS domain S-box-containing protein
MKTGAAHPLQGLSVENLADLVPAMITVYNINTGKYIYINQTIKKLIGYEAEDFLRGGVKFVASLFHPDDLAPMMEKNQSALKAANAPAPDRDDNDPIVSFEYRLRHANGNWVWLQTDGSVFSRGAKGQVEYVINVSIDITERKQAEEELHRLTDKLEAEVIERNERLELAVKASQIGIWEWDMSTDKLTWSPQLKKLFGLSDSEPITYERYISLLHPSDAQRMKDTVENALKTGESYQVEHRAVWPDGSTHWILGQGQAFLENNKPVRMMGTSINIDERKSAEQLKLQTEVLTAERRELKALNKAKDDFISLASHQLRTPATGVKQYIGLLLQGYLGKVPGRYREALQKAYESNERQIKIINDLLMVAKVDAGKLSLNKYSADVIQLIQDIVSEQAADLKQLKQTVSLDLPDSLTANVDPMYLRMVIENILNNASKYSLPGGKIEISVQVRGTTMSISVTDHGVGISKKDRPKIYRKFTRITGVSSSVDGSGLGLYWSKKIVDLHNGKIVLKSRPNHGSTFTIKLPVG